MEKADDGAALIIGRPSKGNDNLTLHFLERSWANNPLAGWVALIATDAADNYARVLEKQHLVLKNPIPEAIPKYESLGFVVANSINRNTYYRREVKRWAHFQLNTMTSEPTRANGRLRCCGTVPV